MCGRWVVTGELVGCTRVDCSGTSNRVEIFIVTDFCQ